MSQWQPIETAPRGKGVRILGWDGSEINTLDWRPPHKIAGHINISDGWEQISDSGRSTVFQPTHWMPLPEPPTGG